jgi:hypothetical protein
MGILSDAIDSYPTDGHYASTSEGLSGYDDWKTDEPWDIDDVYLTPARERFLINRARELRGELPLDEEVQRDSENETVEVG